MRPSHTHLRFRPFVAAALAAAALSVAAASPAFADGMAGMPGMSAEEHAHMSATPAGHDHASMPGMDMSGHAEPAATPQRPVALVLGGFGAFIALVLVYAAVVRRRPAARKRREALARVRSTPPVRTVPAATGRRRRARS